jgi:Flp pilus assembly pilin Flp
VVPSTVQPEPVLSTLPDRSKGGQQVLKLFVAIQNTLAAGRDEEGQTMAEYGVVLAVITIGIVVALTALAGGINGALSSVTSKL